MNKQLYRSHEKVIAGVCSGIAEYFEIDPTIVRIIWLLSIFAGIGIIAYIVCWVAMPEKRYRSFGSSANTQDSSMTRDSSTERNSVDREKSKRVFGIALIIIGAVFLADKFFRWFDINLLIPAAIIVIGVYLVLNARRD